MKALLFSFPLIFLAALSEVANKLSASAHRVKPAVKPLLSDAPDVGSVTVVGQTPGSTPFIAQIQLSVTPVLALRTIRFTISPKPGSVTRPVSATYTMEYLQSRGYINTVTGTVTLPVFGLYAGYSNTVTLSSSFTDNSTDQDSASVVTPAFTTTCAFSSPTVVQARTASTALSYDYFLMKVNCGTQSPAIIDSDGAVRWVGTAGERSYASMSFENGIYMETGTTGISRIEFDGAFSSLQDYADENVTFSGHHNYDPGKQGMLLQVDTTTQTESVILEVDACGNILKTWDLADIIRNTMIAGGNDPNGFVYNAPYDWFHSNAVVYRKSDDSLIISSRENFVICIDYDTGAIKWILGDPTKRWYSYSSLRAYALSLGPNTLPPIGQHSVSLTPEDHLLLFDNGKNSLNQSPPGNERLYSAPRKYRIDLDTFTATEVWNYIPNPTPYSPFCSSVYEDAPGNFLVNYTIAGDIIGLDSAGSKVFHYDYTPGSACATAWNAIPIHLENMVFAGPDPTTDPNGWKIDSVFQQEGNVVVTFDAMAGKTYRVEYKNSLIEQAWQSLSDRTPICNGPVVVTDESAAAQPSRFYRVRELTLVAWSAVSN